MLQILIKIENAVRTHNIVDTCDFDETFASGKGINVNEEPEKKTRNVLKIPVVDVKRTTFDKRKFHESSDAELNLLKQKPKADRTHPPEILHIANEIFDEDMHDRLPGD